MSITHLLSPADILWKILEEHGFDAETIFPKVGITHEWKGLSPGKDRKLGKDEFGMKP